MRTMTRRAAGLEPQPWNRAAANQVAALFDGLAPEWHTRASPVRTRVVLDALTRGVEPLLSRRDLCLEIGSGVGTYSPLFAERFTRVVSADLSWEMVRRSPRATLSVLADGSRLPLVDASVDVVALVNAFLFPEEVERVLVRGGLLLWVSSSGEQTPIHLSTEDVVASLPFAVSGVESRAGAGTWCVLRRA
jgi:SAM-dependent methyltransferase